MKPYIFTYWEGEKPGYVQLCRETLEKHCGLDFEIVALTKDATDQWIKYLPDLPINLKVDWLKANLVYTYGGFWIDADMIVMRNLMDLTYYFNVYDFCGIPGFFGADKGSKMLKEWIDGMRPLLKKPLTFSDLIQPLLNNPNFTEFYPWTRDMICPVYHTEAHDLYSNKKLDITEDNYIVTLYNSAFPENVKKLTQHEILNKPWMMSAAFKRSLNV